MCVFVYDGGPWPTLLADDSWQLPRVHHSVVETRNSRSITPDGMGIRNEMPLLSGQGDDRDPARNRSRRRRCAMRGCMLFQAMARPSSFSFLLHACSCSDVLYIQIKSDYKRGRHRCRVIVTRWTARYAAPARIEDEELRPARPRRAGAPPPRRPTPRPPRLHPPSAAPPPRWPTLRSPRPAPHVRLHPAAQPWREVADVGGGAVRRTEEGGGR